MMALEFYGQYKVRWLFALLVLIALALHDEAFALPGITPLRNTADAYTATNERIRVFRIMGVHTQYHGCTYEILSSEASLR